MHDPSEMDDEYKKMKDSSLYNLRQIVDEVSLFSSSSIILSLQPLEEDPRRDLHLTWKSFTSQPIHLVRQYFGEQIAFYFAWQVSPSKKSPESKDTRQGCFVTLLWPSAIVGLVVFIYGLIER